MALVLSARFWGTFQPLRNILPACIASTHRVQLFIFLLKKCAMPLGFRWLVWWTIQHTRMRSDAVVLEGLRGILIVIMTVRVDARTWYYAGV